MSSHSPPQYRGGLPCAGLRKDLTGALALISIAGMLGFGLFLRSLLLTNSLNNDESYTLYYYILPGPQAFAFGNYLPNDHVLFSAVTWATTSVFGASEVALRAWSIVPGLAALVVFTWWAYHQLGAVAGVVAATLSAFHPVHLSLSTQARGYGLAYLAGAVMLAAAVICTQEKANRIGYVGLGLAGLVGIMTLPVMVLPFVLTVAVLVFFVRRRLLLLGVLLGVGAASLLLYLPLLDQILAASGQEFGRPLPWHGLITGPVADLVQPDIELLVPGRSHWLYLLLGLALSVPGAVGFCRARQVRLVAVLLVPLVGTYLILEAARLYVEPRFVSYLLFNALGLVVLTVVAALRVLSGHLRAAALFRLAIPAAVVAVTVAALRVLTLVGYWSGHPLENYKQVSVLAGYSEPVVVNSALEVGFRVYISDARLSFPSAADMNREVCGHPGPLIYVEYRYYAKAGTPSCVPQRVVKTYLVAQQTGGEPGAPLVYILAPMDRPEQ